MTDLATRHHQTDMLGYLPVYLGITMTDLATRHHQTDKIMLGYLPVYLGIAATYPYIEPRVLEIGIAAGAGMELFRDLFGPNVYGVDNDPDRVAQVNAATGGHAAQFDQDDPDLAEWDPAGDDYDWDVIVDDASHQPGETSRTLANMWPRLAPGGWYVIEDWNYFDAPGMWSVLWPKIMGWWMGHPPQVEMGQERHRTHYSGQFDDMDRVTVQHGMIIIRKGVTI
jgi:SAM-dependent methyltransferase